MNCDKCKKLMKMEIINNVTRWVCSCGRIWLNKPVYANEVENYVMGDVN